MFTFSRKKTGSILGIDLGTSSLKILELSRQTDQFCIEGYDRTLLPDQDISGHLRHLISTAGFSSRHAVLAVPDSLAISKVIQVSSRLQAQDIEECVIMEAEKCIPYPLNEVSLDFNVTGSSRKHAEQLDVLLVASRSEHVMQRVEAVRRAGLVVHIVDVESCAIERASRLLSETGDANVSAIFDLGTSYMRCYVFHDQTPIFSREEALSDDDCELLTTKIKRTLQFYTSATHYEKPGQILLVGGGAGLSGLKESVQRNVGIRTQVANPFEQMACVSTAIARSIKQDAATLMVACGLAVRGVNAIT